MRLTSSASTFTRHNTSLDGLENSGLTTQMNATSYIDLTDFLDEQGELPVALPGPALNIALYHAAIVGWVTRHPANGHKRTNVSCRRSPRRRRCRGEIFAFLERDSKTISWHCPICGDNGFITGWEGTPWDRHKK